MRAYRLVDEHDAQLCEVPVPEPGAGEVLVQVAGAGLCHSDLHLLHAPRNPSCPFTLGHETAGWVRDIGAGVEGFDVGDAVVVHGAWGCGTCAYCQRGDERHCLRRPFGSDSSGLGADGGIAEYILVPSARHLVPLGDLDPVDAGPLDDAALTPYHVIARHRDLLVPDAAAVVIGVGGLGHLAVQLLRAVTAVEVIAIDTSDDKLALARALGADVAVGSDETCAETIREHLSGRGAGLVLDMVGSAETLPLAMSLVAPMGHVSCVGAAMGTIDWSFIHMPYESSIGSTYWGTVAELREVVALAQDGRIEVHAQHYPLEQTGAAYAELEAGRITGRAIVTP